MLQGFIEDKQLFGRSVEIGQGTFWTKVNNISYFHEGTPDRRPQLMRSLPAISPSFTRSVFECIGNWNESDVPSQDYDWTLRAHRLVIATYLLPAARVTHTLHNRTNFKDVWNSWARNAFYDWRARIRHDDLLRTPSLLRSPWPILLCSPALAIWLTIRIIKTSSKYFFKYLYLIPAVYLTKTAWRWEVFHTSLEETRPASA